METTRFGLYILHVAATFTTPDRKIQDFLFFFFIWVLRPFQEYFTYVKPIVHQTCAKTGESGEKPPDHP